MALFGMGQKKQEKQKVAPKKEQVKPAEKSKAAGKKEDKVVEQPAIVIAGMPGGLELSNVLIRPHVTEKATDLSMKGVYAFDVHKSANKSAIKMAIEKYYKVSPRKIAVSNIKTKTMRSNKNGRTVLKKRGGKKALVYLKKGDKIEFV